MPCPVNGVPMVTLPAVRYLALSTESYMAERIEVSERSRFLHCMAEANSAKHNVITSTVSTGGSATVAVGGCKRFDAPAAQM